jgi:nucleotide-binding universal stress UspA family protein
MTTVAGFAPNEEGRAALQAAARECLLRGTDLVVVGVQREQQPLTDEAVVAELGARHAELEGRGLSVRVASSDLRDPADAVVQVAQRVEASLVVLGIRHRTPVGKLILGSVAQRILLEATCPVLAVKPVKG